MSEKEASPWLKYWADIGPKFEAYLQNNRNELFESYLRKSFALYSFLIEDFDTKATQHKELSPKLSVFLVEIHDLMRGIIANQQHMTLAPQALIVRTAFEIYCTYKYILCSQEPEKLADLYDRFQQIEHITGVKASPYLPDPTDEQKKAIAASNPEWFKPGTTNLKVDHWTAIEGMNLRKMAEANHVDLLTDYLATYKTQSKFTHASPLIRNMYRKQEGLRSVPNPVQASQMTFLAMTYCMKILELACKFFGVEFPALDYAVISQDAIKGLGLDKPSGVPK